jgi:(p)ppGpp synthase/HD superfamily hydrolase
MNSVLAIAEAARFAATVHTNQRRKGAKAEPYVNHLAEVACLVARACEGEDVELIIAAWLHDAIEDQNIAAAEIAGRFGSGVAALVQEVTDDKSLPKQIRKQLQVEQVASKSRRARLLKLADKTSNVTAVVDSPPFDWSYERLSEYIQWAQDVVNAGCRGLNSGLEADFDAAVERAASSLTRPSRTR